MTERWTACFSLAVGDAVHGAEGGLVGSDICSRCDVGRERAVFSLSYRGRWTRILLALTAILSSETDVSHPCCHENVASAICAPLFEAALRAGVGL